MFLRIDILQPDINSALRAPCDFKFVMHCLKCLAYTFKLYEIYYNLSSNLKKCGLCRNVEGQMIGYTLPTRLVVRGRVEIFLKNSI